MFRTALLLTASPHAAEDLVQATLVKTYVSWWRVRTADDPVAYVHAILVKTFRSDRRRRSSGELPRTDLVADRPDRTPEPTDRIVLLDALRRLPETDRAVVVLRFWGERAATAGRRLRRRRRAVATSVVAVLAVGAAGWTLPRLAGGPGRDALTAADPGSAASVSVTLTSFVRDNVDRTPGEPLHEQAGYLVGRVTTADGELGSVTIMLSPPAAPATPAAHDDSAGTATNAPGADGSTAVMEPTAPTWRDRISCPGNLEAPTSCRELVDEAGRHVGRTSSWTDGVVTVLEVTIRTADDGLVYGAVANTTDDKWGVGSGATADLPPLTRDQLRQVVEDAAWTTFVPAG
ncbi:MAG: sigma factor [Nocardioidaceae bacterium]